MERTFNNEFFDETKQYLNNIGTELVHININDFHDCFWITKDGIVFGTSLNGIGRKLCYSDAITRNDAKDILDDLKEQANGNEI